MKKNELAFVELLKKSGIGSVEDIRQKKELDSLPQSDAPSQRGRRKKAVSPRLDLHGQSCDEAKPHLIDFLMNCERQGIKRVIIVTGIGQGILKRMAMAYLEELVAQRRISSYQTASAKNGGFGALEVHFR